MRAADPFSFSHVSVKKIADKPLDLDLDLFIKDSAY